MFYLGFMVGTLFGVFLVALLRSNKQEDTEHYMRKAYDAGYEKGYADGMSEGYSIKK